MIRDIMPASGWLRTAPIVVSATLIGAGCTYDFDRYDPNGANDDASAAHDSALPDAPNEGAPYEDSPGTPADALPDEAGPPDGGRATDGAIVDAAAEDTGLNDAPDDATRGPDGPSVDGSAPLFTVGGTLAGLHQGRRVTLQDNGGDSLTVSSNGPFVFSQDLASGATYRVTVSTQPQGQTCRAMSATGTVLSANVTTVSIACQ